MWKWKMILKKSIYIVWFDYFPCFMIIRSEPFENKIMSKLWLDPQFRHCFKWIFILKCRLHIRVILAYVFIRLMFKFNRCMVQKLIRIILKWVKAKCMGNLWFLKLLDTIQLNLVSFSNRRCGDAHSTPHVTVLPNPWISYHFYPQTKKFIFNLGLSKS